MYKVTKRDCPMFGIGPYVCEFICDTASDITTLPTSISEGTGGRTAYDNQKCASGSIATVAENGSESKQYMLNNQDIWCPYSIAVGNSGGGSSGSPITIDFALSETSENPVANKVIVAALNEKANKTDIPTKVSQLENDSGYLTEHQDLSEYAKTSEVNTAVSSINTTLGTKANKTDIPDLSAYAKKTDVPNIKVNAAVNADTVGGHSVGCDVPENAVFTDTVPDLSPYAKKTDIPTKLPANGGNADMVNGHSVEADVPANAVFTDTKVTSPSNHYTPVKSITKSASGGTLTDITNSTLGTQVVTGVEMDAKGHVTGVASTALKTSVPVIISLTRNEYDALSTKDPNTHYMITDDVGDMSDAVVLNVGNDKEFASFTSAMWVAAGITDQKVVVNVYAGEYDVYSELGGDNYIIGIGSSEWRDIQPFLSGNVEIKGIGNVVLKLEIPNNIYTNNKTNCEKVSTISTERNILVENITFVNKNCRYSIHDECGNSEGAANTKHIFRNCRFYNDNTISCIGVGTVTGYFEVENCYTENTTTGSFFLHDWIKSTGGNLIIKNCVFNSESGIDVILSVNSNPESVFDVYLSNNIFEKLAITGVDTSRFSTNVFRVIGVHNTITTTAVNESLTNPYPIKLY